MAMKWVTVRSLASAWGIDPSGQKVLCLSPQDAKNITEQRQRETL